jgi:predicted amidohydrolase YtcJ
VGGVKEFADGSIQGYTGYLSEPYHVIPEGLPADYRGFPHYTRDALAEKILEIHAAGRQAIVHGNGDAAIDDILYGFRQAQEAFPREDTRHVINHAQMAREDQLDEMKELGVIPSFFVLHTYYWGDRHRDIFMGPERAARMSPTQSAEARGIRYTIHTDTPIVPMEPMRLIWSAVNRVSTSGAVIGANQAVSPIEALRATTIDAAHMNFEEDIKGSIEVGKLADLVVLSDNPLEVDRMAIKDITVEKTIVGGEVVYAVDEIAGDKRAAD